MHALASIHRARKEHDKAFEWNTKGAETGLPKAMTCLGLCLDKGEGVAVPDYPAAAGWYLRAANAGSEDAEGHLAGMYTVGRGGGPADNIYACRIIRRVLDPRGVSSVKRHPTTSRAVPARPWGVASSVASRWRCGGCAKLPRTATQARASARLWHVR